MSSTSYSLQKKRIREGIFFAEVNEFLRRYLAEEGYAGVQIKPKQGCQQVVIQCTKTADVVKKIPEIQKCLQLRHGLKAEKLRVFAERVQPRGLSARAQAQSICYKLKNGVAVRRACYGVLKYIMDNGQAKGVQIIISGKLRGARAKAMKFKEGFMISSGDATNDYIVEAVEHVLLRSGTIGVRVKIMLPRETKPDRSSFLPKADLPDVVNVRDPKTFDFENYDAKFDLAQDARRKEIEESKRRQQEQDMGVEDMGVQDYGAPQEQYEPQEPQEYQDYQQQMEPQQQYDQQQYAAQDQYQTPGY